MIDDTFRKVLPRLSLPLVNLLIRLKVTPNQLTVSAALIALLAAAALAQGHLLVALGLWWFSRLWDGLDGILARATDSTSDFGALLDIQLDMMAYSAMVVGFYLQFPQYALQWVLMLFGYVLCITGALSLGNLENLRGIDAREQRDLRLATGLAEGGETGMFYTLFLLLPNWLGVTTWIWLGVLAVTVIARLELARRELSYQEQNEK
ncbi:CDP-alcohol phosphatidyltransferase family protein [Halioglobus pacificus]|uniref:Membrane protein n=1 Tax=Parahalioglobus pacificus TaxID=930806 RepID=A0A918XHX3_9GAMM|nr:CDP-alcohol phosphatidyltransferase family protein [Halioglobus pacificus]GHD32867.1 membrane protein [Halioglobus pacificus]